MAKKRMFNSEVLDTDAFLDMPFSAQALYFHLNLRADDDGFISNPKRIRDYIKASEDDLKILIAKRFLIVFPDGVVVVKHWRMHNTIRKDRYTPTAYQEDLAMLGIKANEAYTTDCAQMIGDGCQVVAEWLPSGCQVVSTDIDKGLDKGLDTGLDIDTGLEPAAARAEYQKVVDMYNDICISYPRVKALSETRKKAIKARLKVYSMADIQTLFEKAEASDFLKGNNKKNWSATFDWLLSDGNMAKVLDGNYDNRNKPTGNSIDAWLNA